MTSKLSILHWNDVYRVGPQKLDPKSSETIDVTQFAQQLIDRRAQWSEDTAGLSLFSGDLFSPSVETSVTRGSHMVPVINLLAPDVSLTGNHDFDLGFNHLTKLVKDTTFPWLLSNVIDTDTSKTPETLHEFYVIEKAGIKIGVIGLVEKDWIATVASWPPNFKWKDMTETGIDLSKRLRDPNGEFKDVALAKTLFASSPAEQEKHPVTNVHGVDLILGGHDHLYYVSSGVTSWNGYDITQPSLGAEEDKGDILVVKSGMDFRDLSEINIQLADSPEGSVRRKVVQSITGMRLETKPGSPSNSELKSILEKILKSVGSTLKAPVCRTTTTLDLRSRFIRTEESAAGNWFADVIRHAYDDALCIKSGGGADITFICAGTYGPDLEAALKPWPAQEGRFPVISGMRVSWDSSREAGQRVLGVWLLKDDDASSDAGDDENALDDGEPIVREKGGRKYKVVTREYLAGGHDGFEAFKGYPYLIDDESGALTSTLVRQYLLGSHMVNRLSRLVKHPSKEDLHENTKKAIVNKHKREQRRSETAASRWKGAVSKILHPKEHYQDHTRVARTEHLSSVDPCDGAGMRRGEAQDNHATFDGADLLEIHPVVDGRLKDVGRQ
ncbi:Metallo-dependent phosphatase-like protein [Flagelloscypha sp. PMI_526]|nr:Metallo-dependent phosphatase-like protein [Flagelloscypha sp. PMI_526]